MVSACDSFIGPGGWFSRVEKCMISVEESLASRGDFISGVKVGEFRDDKFMPVVGDSLTGLCDLFVVHDDLFSLENDFLSGLHDSSSSDRNLPLSVRDFSSVFARDIKSLAGD